MIPQCLAQYFSACGVRPEDDEGQSLRPKVIRFAGWYTRSPKESGYTAPRVGVAAGAGSKRYPGFEEAWVYQTGILSISTPARCRQRHCSETGRGQAGRLAALSR